MRELCPCRNEVQDISVWQKVFQAAHQPGARVRGRAIHAIATLLQRAKTSGRWRAVLKDLADELDGVLSDPDACKLLRQQVQHNAKAEGNLTPAAHCKKLRRIVELKTPNEVADWVNKLLGHRPPRASTRVIPDSYAYGAGINIELPFSQSAERMPKSF